ncbi:Protein arginine N-methyltransferase 3 [Geranomyces variabilis]|uniref:type I protein arginine methyltransferase n=1 Tax=Geranomyces variabilis TaxID=109894 RepID=A0AAD5TC02_9FUNG|nr:Protein arginine N-methyltransferase 3 [Geranomyces variabilis]
MAATAVSSSAHSYCYEVASSIGDAERDLHSEFGDDVDARWDDWEDDGEGAVCECPFCHSPIPSAAETLVHCRSEHAFDFTAVRKALALDFYASIRLINHVRTTWRGANGVTMDTLLAAGRTAPWVKDDTLLQPVLDDDPLLYAFEDDEDEEEIADAEEKGKIPKPVSSTTTTASSSTHDDGLVARLAAAELRASLAEQRLDELTVAFMQYKDMVKEAFLLDAPAPSTAAAIAPEANVENEGEEGEDQAWHMDYYFGSYAETEIHESMLKDQVRTESYRDFAYHNKAYFKGKVVLDVGCGTGILSMFAARAGAKHVYAVDNSTIINKARRIAKENGLENVITFVQGKIEEVQLPVDTVDIIVSEWMGYFLLYEGMLDSVLTARDRWLAPDGIVAPSRSDILICAIQDEEWINEKYTFWSDVYGFQMNTMKRGFLNDGNVDFVDPKTIISTTATLKRIDIESVRVEELDFETPFRLEIVKAGRVNGLCGWFDIWFEGHNAADTTGGAEISEVFFSTGPQARGTHWKQTAFAFENALEVDQGSVLQGTFRCVKDKDNHRELTVELDFAVTDAKGVVTTQVKRSYQVR